MGGPPPDNPTEETAKRLVEVGQALELLTRQRVELILKALEEGGSTRRVGFLSGTNESFVRRVLKDHGTDALKKKISDRYTATREQQNWWPYKSEGEWRQAMRRTHGKWEIK